MRRAYILMHLGRFREAHQDLCRALPYLRRAGDTVWEARSLTHRAEVFLGLGLPGRAAADFARAEELFATSGQEREYAIGPAQPRAGRAESSGDLPEALTYLRRGRETLRRAGRDQPRPRHRPLLGAAGGRTGRRSSGETDAALAPDASGGRNRVQEGGTAVRGRHCGPGRGRPGRRERAGRSGAPAVPGPATGCLGGACRPRLRPGQVRGRRAHPPACSAHAEQVAARLDANRAGEALQAHLLAGRLALSRGRAADADRHLEAAARYRRRKPPLTRSVAWLARALQAEAHDDARATRAACARGLDALDEHQMTLGATELRAYGTAHGAELAALAQRDALRRGDVRRLLQWSERSRATALASRGAPGRARPGARGRAVGAAQRDQAPQRG